MKKKDNITQNQTQTIDYESGELLEQTTTQVIPVGTEPNYYKVYLQDLANLQGLNPTEKEVLEVLSSNMSFDNIIVVIKPIKEKLSKITGKSFETIRSSIQGLVNKGMLIREERACYRVNPKYIAKGKWQDIKALRLVVEYSERGRQINVENITPHSITYTIKDNKLPHDIEDFNNENQLDLF
ncbi:replication/maintenance protein RepL [Empedobacter falsenii]|jgi:predicted transcriptional regulator